MVLVPLLARSPVVLLSLVPMLLEYALMHPYSIARCCNKGNLSLCSHFRCFFAVVTPALLLVRWTARPKSASLCPSIAPLH
eukprot:652416-Pleurochrysis_carterae.AAC.1